MVALLPKIFMHYRVNDVLIIIINSEIDSIFFRIFKC